MASLDLNMDVKLQPLMDAGLLDALNRALELAIEGEKLGQFQGLSEHLSRVISAYTTYVMVVRNEIDG